MHVVSHEKLASKSIACSSAWSRVDNGLPGGRVLSFANVDKRTVEALVATSQAHPAARYVSRDQGATWMKLRAALPTAEPRTLVRVPGSASLLYLVGLRPADQLLAIWRSANDGESWVERSRLDDGCDEILALEADRIFVRCRAPNDLSSANDRVLRSDDGAVSFMTYLELPEIGGFALTPNHLGAWVGSRSGGLWLADRSGKLLSLNTSLHVGCLQYTNDTLWVCTRDESGYDEYALATSRDGGYTLMPFLRSADVSALQTCGNPLQSRVCSSEWNQWLADLALSSAAPSAGAMALPAAAEAVSVTPPAAATCAVHTVRTRRVPMLLHLICLVLIWRAQRGSTGKAISTTA